MKLPSLRTLVLIGLCLAGAQAQAQTCHYGRGATGLEADLRDLRARPTCQDAYALYRKCLWGSSADPARADVVIKKCQAGYRNKLTETQTVTLNDKLKLCSLEYEGMDGTLWLSESSSCALAVYVDFATDPAKASEPIPRASFDCAHAQTPLEHAVCSDAMLGHFDLLMAEAYKGFLGELKGKDKAGLIQNQRAWNASTPGVCALESFQPAPTKLACLRNRYRQRMQDLHQCAVGADIGCITSPESQ